MRSAAIRFFILVFCLSAIPLTAQKEEKFVSPYEVTKKTYKPKKELVHDFASLFNPVERADLERILVAYDDSTSVQIVVVTFKKLEGYPIELLGNEIGENWGVGQKEEHNGIVIVIAEDDRQVTLRGGYGIQAKMPRTVEKLIIDNDMIPEFKRGDYYQGVLNGITAIQEQLAGEYRGIPKKKKTDDGTGAAIAWLVIILLIIFFLAAMGGGGPSGGYTYSRRGRSPFGGFGGFGSGGFGGGFGGGSSGGGFGGGFGGFGGGSFGGGGASGSW